MKPDSLSRRGFLGGMLVAVTVCLCPPLSRATAAPCRLSPTTRRQPIADGFYTSYGYNGEVQGYVTFEYDGRGRLVRSTDCLPPASFPYESGTMYHYQAQG
jgi:hypothetical protein